MSKQLFLLSLVAAGVSTVVFVETASATNRNVTLCAEYKADFTDSGLGLPVSQRDDYMYSNSNKIARGVKLRIVSSEPGAADIDLWTDWTGADAGCADVVLDDIWTYDVKILSRTKIDDVYVEVNSTGSTAWSSTPLQNWTPVAGTTDIETVNAHRAWNMTAAMSWALYRRRYGVSGETFVSHTDDVSPCSATAAACQSGGELWFRNTSSLIGYRYVHVHELGHLLAYKFDGHNSSNKNYNSAAPTCQKFNGGTDGHAMSTKEHASAAAVEGFGHYYAAVAFNNTSQSDCAFMYNKTQDFDRTDAATSDFSPPDSISCEGSPVWDLSIVDARDYVDDMCTGTLNHRGNELDFLRFFWDLDTDEGLSFGEVAELYDRANPRSWNAVGSNGSSDNVWDRLQTAAAHASLGISSEVAAQANNGVDH